MYCSHCGREIDDKAVICVGCGTPTEKKSEASVSDKGSFGWALLGFLMPLAGLILWVIWNDSEPNNAKKAGMGALIGTILSVVLIVLFYVLYFVLLGFMLMNY